MALPVKDQIKYWTIAAALLPLPEARIATKIGGFDAFWAMASKVVLHAKRGGR